MKLTILPATLLVFLANALAIAVPGTTGTVNGLVQYSKTRTPADTVLVTLEASTGGHIADVQTDENGKFVFDSVPTGAYWVIASAPGYQDVRQNVDLQSTRTAWVQIQLTLDSQEAASSSNGLYKVDARIPAAAWQEYEKGRSALTVLNLNKAIGHLEKAVSIAPVFADAQLLLGTAYMDSDEWSKAESALQHAVAADPKSSTGLCALGEVYLHTGRYIDAEDKLLSGIRLDDNSFRGHLALSRVYYAIGNLAKAGAEAGRAIQLKPDVPAAHLLAGNILFKARQADKALPFFESYLRLDPTGAYAKETRDLVVKIKNALGITPH